MVYRIIAWKRRGARLGTKVASKGTQGAKKIDGSRVSTSKANTLARAVSNNDKKF